MKQVNTKPAPYKLGAIRAQLFYHQSGRLSPDVLSTPGFMLYNIIIGEGSAEEPSLHTLVTVEVVGKPGDDSLSRTVEVVCEWSLRGKKQTVTASEDPQRLGTSGKWIVPVWLKNHPGVPVKVTARLKGQGSILTKTATINYQTGE
jgi:hypothetical protein